MFDGANRTFKKRFLGNPYAFLCSVCDCPQLWNPKSLPALRELVGEKFSVVDFKNLLVCSNCVIRGWCGCAEL